MYKRKCFSLKYYSFDIYDNLYYYQWYEKPDTTAKKLQVGMLVKDVSLPTYYYYYYYCCCYYYYY